MESYKATPEPCTSMKVVVGKDINSLEKKSNNTLNINVIYPVEFTEIKQEKVKGKKTIQYFLKHSGFHLGKFVGECWWLHWIFSWNIIDAATADHNRYICEYKHSQRSNNKLRAIFIFKYLYHRWKN